VARRLDVNRLEMLLIKKFVIMVVGAKTGSRRKCFQPGIEREIKCRIRLAKSQPG